MNALIICLPEDIRVQDIAEALMTVGRVEILDTERILITADDSRAWLNLDVDRELDGEYEPEELRFIHSEMESYSCYTLDYLNIDLAKAVACALVTRWKAVVDTDAGFLGTGDQFCEIVANNPSWDWRTKP